MLILLIYSIIHNRIYSFQKLFQNNNGNAFGIYISFHLLFIWNWNAVCVCVVFHNWLKYTHKLNTFVQCGSISLNFIKSKYFECIFAIYDVWNMLCIFETWSHQISDHRNNTWNVYTSKRPQWFVQTFYALIRMLFKMHSIGWCVDAAVAVGVAAVVAAGQ